jgi:hypothetical protein
MAEESSFLVSFSVLEFSEKENARALYFSVLSKSRLLK